MSRYDNLFNVGSATENIPPVGEIPKKETDVYLPYNDTDRLDLMSYRVYADPQYWWLILAANGYQLEFDIEYGEILRVPYPLSETLNAIRENLDG